MSRLPRLRSTSPDAATAGPSMPSRVIGGVKRKAPIAEEDDEALDQPRKLPAIGAGKPLQPSRAASNVTTTRGGTSKNRPLARSHPSGLARSTRSMTAPTATAKAPPKPAPAARSVKGRAASTSGPPKTTAQQRAADDKRFNDIQTKLSSIDAARAADAERLAKDMEAERAKVLELQSNQENLSRELATAKSEELTQRRELTYAAEEIEKLKKKFGAEILDLELDLKKKTRELWDVTEDLRNCRGDLERERDEVTELKATISHQSTAHITLTTQNQVLEAQNSSLQSQLDAQSKTITELTLKLEKARMEVDAYQHDAMESEMVRRKLHNMVQELKGNIRVFCRVRPVLPSDFSNNTGVVSGKTAEDLQANLYFPDGREHKEIVVHSSTSSATGAERKEEYHFSFDRVFEPNSTQAEVFEEISQLAQSCIDGYNVCIFAYGQTGSGKSFTMEGGRTEETLGMIPRAVEQVFKMAEHMKTKGWEYKLEGQFLEIYNETINDLLGKHEFDKKKHEIKHDPKTGSTRVTDVEVIPLHSASQVKALLARAQSRRSVAATLMNERSSRSHSVFTLRITGVNVGCGTVATEGTGEKCEGCLNLVDLAGSERLNVSFNGNAPIEKDRVRETQNINKSLSALGDVIAALGERGTQGNEGKHIPYRNSKLTYLLQNSLSGSSKTLMFLNLSPLAVHLQESLTSLRFATKVNSTMISNTKKQTKS